MAIQESGEMYLETILVLSKKNGSVRSVDIAQEMDFSKAAVSKALSRMKEEDYVSVDDNGSVTLSEKGREIAEKIYERHNVIASVLIRLGVDEKVAYEDACKMEHDISEESFRAIKEHLKTK